MESYSEYTDKGMTRRYRTFDKITNPTDAYFLGFIGADGGYTAGIKKPSGKSYPRMSVSSITKNIVEGIQQRYCPDVALCKRGLRNSGKFIARTPAVELHFPRVLGELFKRYGIFSHKPERRLVGIPKAYLSAYVLGLLDADGCFVVRRRKDCRTPRLNIHIVSSAHLLLQDVQRVLECELGIASSVYSRNTNCHELRISNTQSAIRFGHWVYSNLPEFYYLKKHQIFNQYISEVMPTSCPYPDELLETQTLQVVGNQQPN